MWEDISQTLKEFSAPIVWIFPPEQIQNPDEVGKYLKENCNDSSKEKKLIAMCRALANGYHTLLDTAGQQIQPEEQEGESAADTPGSLAAAKLDGEPKSTATTPVQRRKHKTKSTHPVDGDEESEPSQPVEEFEPEIITKSPSLESFCNL